MSRVAVYVDGFNLYHAIDDLGENYLKWVNLWALSENIIKPDQTIELVKYFSAYATWKTGEYRRHQAYVGALEAHGVEPIMGRFKAKKMVCHACHKVYTAHEEKETDVNIGVHLVADAIRNRFDTAFIISADTDLSAAVKMARAETPEKTIMIVAPPGRFSRNREIRPLFEITKGKIRSSLLPATITTETGRVINRPPQYSP